jgi:hypothetical protein
MIDSRPIKNMQNSTIAQAFIKLRQQMKISPLKWGSDSKPI